MASTLPTPNAIVPVTEDAFLADRTRFWDSFTGFTVGGIVAVIVVVLMVLYFIL